MPSWQGKSRGNKTGFRIFVWVLKHAGLAPAYFLLLFVAFYFFIFSGRAFRYQFYYFRRRIGYSWFKSLMSVYRNYYWFGQVIIDKIVLLSGIKNPFLFDFEGEQHLREMADMKKGGLLLSAHIGNWEIAGHLLQRLKTRINIVMYDGEERQIKDYLESITEKNATRIILIKDDLSHIYAIQEALSKNEFVCMHADRFLETNKTIQGKLLGMPAPFPVGPFVLAQTFRMPVSFVFAMKDSAYRYHFYATAPQIFSREDPAGKMLEGYCENMEKILSKYPLQWFNYYDFWKAF